MRWVGRAAVLVRRVLIVLWRRRRWLMARICLLLPVAHWLTCIREPVDGRVRRMRLLILLARLHVRWRMHARRSR